MSEGTLSYMKGENERLRKENAARRVREKEAKAEATRLQGELEKVTKKATDLETKQGDPSDLQATVDGLKTQLRTIKHRGVFAKLAADEGIDPSAIDDAWEVLKLKADTDEPDPAAIQTALTAAKETKKYLFRSDEAATTTTTPPARPLGADRGKAAGGAGRLKLTREQRRDAEYMMRNDDAIKAHQAAGTLDYGD